jgi:hypothetical protein
VAAWTWIFAAGVLNSLVSSYPNVFSPGTVIYENIGTGSPSTVTNAVVNPYQGWDSYAATVAGPINSAATGLMYDNESWTNTPVDEQQSPEAYMRLYALEANALSKFLIFAPGDDLATQNDEATSGCLSFVRLRFAEIMAKGLQLVTASSVPSVLHVQAQSQLPGYGSITTMEPFGAFISTVKAQLQPYIPSSAILSGGITLNTTVTTAPPLISAVGMMRDMGYGCCWFNVPGTPTSAQLSIVAQVIAAAQAA